ncbi:MM3350-like domain-containing protein [Mycena alexandri]|uniref:MM3350-like domain-containing protein n=1 Tax=Mycena alexandri TaxID=1745969 RepID=A0AAD6TIV2_9AGAR|nr:MM3350-like domain-containing protein [Mycena alexandri]
MPPYTSTPASTKTRKEQEKLLRPRVINGKQTYVKFLPQDDLEAIHPVYLTDPANFKPRRHRRGDMLEWGIVELDMSVQLSMMEKIRLRMKQDSAMAKCMYHGQLQPQVQFIQGLMELKKAKIKAARDSQRELRDFVLTIRLRSTESASCTKSLMSRRIKVAGATKLSVFQDKILAPALGWTRNYHGYLFVDDNDGSQYGPDGGSHIDLMFLKDNGHTYLDDHEFSLADILPEPNPTKPAFHYIYDLGDYWFHDIYVDEILPASDSDGKVTLLAGTGACPREDGQGFRRWNEYIASPLTTAKHAEIANAMNYCEDPEVRRLGARWRFDPLAFDLAAARKRISDALASPASVPSGPKKAVVGDPFAFARRRAGADGDSAPKGTHRTVVPLSDAGFNGGKTSGALAGAFQTEVVRDRRDKRASALCACCGKPITEPRMCSACKKVYYCDRVCQTTHWKKEHKRQCTARTAAAQSTLVK